MEVVGRKLTLDLEGPLGDGAQCQQQPSAHAGPVVDTAGQRPNWRGQLLLHVGLPSGIRSTVPSTRSVAAGCFAARGGSLRCQSSGPLVLFQFICSLQVPFKFRCLKRFKLFGRSSPHHCTSLYCIITWGTDTLPTHCYGGKTIDSPWRLDLWTTR